MREYKIYVLNFQQLMKEQIFGLVECLVSSSRFQIFQNKVALKLSLFCINAVALSKNIDTGSLIDFKFNKFKEQHLEYIWCRLFSKDDRFQWPREVLNCRAFK